MRLDADSYVFPGAFRPILSLDALFEIDADGLVDFNIAGDWPGPDACAERSEAIAAVNRFVDDLPQRDRIIIQSLFWEDRTQTEIAYTLGVSKMAISKAVSRILRHARQFLVGHEQTAFAH